MRPGDFRSDETCEQRFRELGHAKSIFGHSQNLWPTMARPGAHGLGPEPMGPSLPFISCFNSLVGGGGWGEWKHL